MKKSLLFLSLVLAMSLPCFAISVCGLVFDDNAFADEIGAYSGSWGGATLASMQSILLGPTVGDSIYSNNASEYITILFTDNAIQNRAGNDLAVFEESGAGTTGSAGCVMNFTINNVTRTATPYWISGTTYVAYINLDDFGVPTNAVLSSIIIRGSSDPDYTAFGAINNVNIPEPTTFLFLGLGIAFFAFKKR